MTTNAISSRKAPHPLLREFFVLGLLALALLAGTRLSTHFLDVNYLLDATSLSMETGIIALGMTCIIISGQIDLSVASTLALTACVTAVLMERVHLPLPLAIVCGLVLGLLLGIMNGLMIAYLRLPALAVTLGTFALYRGAAQILLGDHSISRFPDWFLGIDYRRVVGPVPMPLVIFLVMAVGFGLFLHRTMIGRWIVATGANREASLYSGVPVKRLTVGLFALSGFLSALGGLMMTSRLNVARFDMATGLELDVITAVVLGGTDIFGGRGTVFGTVIALFLLAFLKTGMGLANIKAETQMIVIGLLLLASLILPKLLAALRGQR